MSLSPPPLRSIRSFVMRGGRLRPSHKQAIESQQGMLLPYREAPLCFNTVFGRVAPIVLEIGFGMGHHLVEMATQRPECNFIGVEVHPPGIGRVLSQIQPLGLKNLRVIGHDVCDVLEKMIPAGTLAEAWLLFPDPWPKKKHHKRRLVQTSFIDSLAHVIQPGGTLTLATDWLPYAEWMLEKMDTHSAWDNAYGPGQRVPEGALSRPTTKFEKRGQALGYAISEMVYRRR